MVDKVVMWNGGTTNEKKYNEMIRNSEDYLDKVDVESRTEDIKNQINKNMDKPAPITGGRGINRYRKPEGSEQ